MKRLDSSANVPRFGTPSVPSDRTSRFDRRLIALLLPLLFTPWAVAISAPLRIDSERSGTSLFGEGGFAPDTVGTDARRSDATSVATAVDEVRAPVSSALRNGAGSPRVAVDSRDTWVVSTIVFGSVTAAWSGSRIDALGGVPPRPAITLVRLSVLLRE